MYTPTELEARLLTLVTEGRWRGTMTDLAAELGLEVSGRAMSKALEREPLTKVTVRRVQSRGRRIIEIARADDLPANVVAIRPDVLSQRAPREVHPQSAPPPGHQRQRAPRQPPPAGPTLRDELGDAITEPATPMASAAAHLAYAALLVDEEIGSSPELEAVRAALSSVLPLFDQDDVDAARALPRAFWERASPTKG